MNAGLLIKKRREQLGLNQTELSYKLGYTSRSSVNKLERQEYLTLAQAKRISEALDIDYNMLIQYQEMPEEKFIEMLKRYDLVETVTEHSLNKEDEKILDFYRALNSKGKRRIMELAEDLLDNSKYKAD
ncbi:transcriptional regulator with XRE-family HTH domain [Lachnospiraceae bacterium PF1-22]